MATVGKVHRQKDGSYLGYVKTSEMKRQVNIVITPLKGPKASDRHPDFRVTVGDNEAGAAWKKKATTGKNIGQEYISVTLEEPAFGPQKLYCNLGKAPDGKADEFNLIWNAQR